MVGDGYCACGCNQRTRLAVHTDPRRGWVKGQPLKFILGHVTWKQGALSDIDYFWSLVTRTATCWLWTGAIQQGRGYGLFKGQGAHRWISIYLHGAIPPGQQVLHQCDVRACVNPDHLFRGSAADNTQDMMRKGRQRSRPHLGSAHGQAKLTESVVLDIRQRYAQGEPQPHLAREYRVSQCAVSNIVLRKTWRHLP